MVFPKQADGARNWIWRARFWGTEPQTDRALLAKGFHLVYLDVADMFGNSEAVELWNGFYEFVRAEYGLAPRAVLEGFSRGGLIVYNWAAQNTSKVACIYADAPVCDIKSWPGGLFTGVGSEKDWRTALAAHGLDQTTVQDYEGIPLYTCKAVTKAGIPVIHVYGDADMVVPPTENTLLLAKSFKAAGGKIKLIRKKRVGHHPHSLEDPKRIVNFILKKVNGL